MIIIKELEDSDLNEAMKLRVLCWPEVLAGSSSKELNMDEQITFWFHWKHHGVDNNDVRVMLGAYEEDNLLGAAFASFAEKEDAEKGVEINGLWVYPHMRGKGVSLMLMTKILDYYKILGMEEVIIYSYHNAPSNRFYRKFGAEVHKTEFQMEEKVPTDIFKADIDKMNNLLKKSLEKYSDNL